VVRDRAQIFVELATESWLAPDTCEGLRTAWGLLDTNRDGVLSWQDFAGAMDGVPLWTQLQAAFDANHEGTISDSEFSHGFVRRALSLEQPLQGIFPLFSLLGGVVDTLNVKIKADLRAMAWQFVSAGFSLWGPLIRIGRISTQMSSVTSTGRQECLVKLATESWLAPDTQEGLMAAWGLLDNNRDGCLSHTDFASCFTSTTRMSIQVWPELSASFDANQDGFIRDCEFSQGFVRRALGLPQPLQGSFSSFFLLGGVVDGLNIKIKGDLQAMAWQFANGGGRQWEPLFRALGAIGLRPAGCARFLDAAVPEDMV